MSRVRDLPGPDRYARADIRRNARFAVTGFSDSPWRMVMGGEERQRAAEVSAGAVEALCDRIDELERLLEEGAP